MRHDSQVHLVTAGIVGSVVGGILLVWAFPRLFVFLMLGLIVAVFYGAVYMVVAAKLDPRVGPPDDPNAAGSPAAPAAPAPADRFTHGEHAKPAQQADATAPVKKSAALATKQDLGKDDLDDPDLPKEIR